MSGILSEPIDLNGPRRRRPDWPPVAATRGLVVRHRTRGHVGTIMRFTPDWVTIRDQNGREHTLHNEGGAFSVDGRSVKLVAPAPVKNDEIAITASGSVAVPNASARVAQPSRLLVEGLHDAELVEKVWGDDLRIEGIVVEPLHGADDLQEVVRSFGPRPGRRLGILLDHLIDGTKETHIAAAINHPDVLITGHPYVDVWQAVRPETLGIAAWPTIPKGTDWKRGICQAFRFDGEPGALWKRILAQVNTYKDLEPALVGAVESLIDFVAAPEDALP
ncbi:MAG: hypothetical protein ACI8TP_004700 [Acidimicrobiales bacterium]|jgi:hypothetical protein